jgi:hypothetical protein
MTAPPRRIGGMGGGVAGVTGSWPGIVFCGVR